MSGGERPKVVIDPAGTDSTPRGTAPLDAPASVASGASAAPPKALAGSILGQLHTEHEKLAAGTTTILPVGRSTILAARYRALSDDDREQLERRSTAAGKIRNISERDDTLRRIGALTLALACEELLWLDEQGDERPLVQALADEAVDTLGPEPMKFDRRTARVLTLDVADDANAPDVVLALHRHGDGYTPLDAALLRYADWLTEGTQSTLDEVLGGR